MRLRSVVIRCAAALAVLAAALPLSACGAPAARSAASAQSNSASSRPAVVAIGDSITAGRGLAAGQAWPILVARTRGWAMTNLGTSGAGFSATGTGDETYSAQIADAAELHPQIVLINGSDNDIGDNQGIGLVLVTNSDMHALRTALPHATIIALSVIAPKSSAADIAKVNTRVAATVKLVHGVYLDIGTPLAGKDGMLQSDGEHPTAAGQQVLADAINKALDAKHIAG